MECKICKSKITKHFANKNGYVFYRCIKCKTIFLNHLPSVKKLNNYYSSQFSYTDGLKNEILIRKRSKQILMHIKKYLPYGKTLCDVGSGYGFFLNEAHAAQYKIFGIEPSQQLVRHAKKHFGVHTFLGSLTKYTNSQKKQFDIVTCIHVIEHVTNPKQFITLLLKIVKPGGLLYIETPNSDSHLLYVERESYTFLIPPDHLWLFSQQSIKQLLPKYSSIISINTYSYSEHLMGIIKRIIKSLSLSERSEESTERNEEKKREEFTLSNSKGLDPSANHFRMIQKFKKNLSYLLFDRTLAPFLTGTLNWNHKGSILELYIRKNK